MKHFLVKLSALYIFASGVNTHAKADIAQLNNLYQSFNSNLMSNSASDNDSDSLTLEQDISTDKSHEVFYQNLVLSIPHNTYLMVNMVAFVNMMMIQTDQTSAEDALNPADPNFAHCMHTAIEQKFNEPAFNEAYNNYLTSVSKNDLAQDKIFFNHPVTVFNNKLYFNVFEELSQNENIEQNYQLSEQLRNQIREYDDDSIPISELSGTYRQNFGNKSRYALVIANQIEKCHEVNVSSI